MLNRRAYSLRIGRIGPLLVCLGMSLGATSALAVDGDARERGLYESARQLSAAAEDGFEDVALTELRSYLRLFPRGRFIDDVYLRLARVHLERGEHRLAAARLLQVLIMCRGSLREVTAREELMERLDSRRFRADRPRYQTALERFGGEKAEKGSTRLAFVRALLMIDHEDTVGIVASESVQLIDDVDDDDELALALFAIADYQRRHRVSLAAVATLERIGHLWPGAPFRSRALLAAGEVLQTDLRRPVEAMARYRVVVRDHADRPEAATAWLRLGDIERDELDRHEIALRNYDEVLNRYPDHPDAFAAMMARAETLIDGFRDHRGAVEALVLGASRYAQHPRAPEALDRAGRIADKDLKEPRTAAGYYADLAERYPGYGPAADRLWRAGQLLEKDDDPAGARSLYRLLVDRFPDSKLASKASKRLDKLGVPTP